MNTELKQAIKRAKRALDGDSNDEEHDALFELVEALEAKPQRVPRPKETAVENN